MKNLFDDNSGVSVIEIIVVIAILASAFFAIISAATITFASAQNDEFSLRAKFLAEEGMEAARAFRDDNYWLGSPGLGSLAAGTYYLDSSTGKWLLSASPTDVYDIFSRTVSVGNVYRDSNSNITLSGGTLDPNTRLITVTVSWQQRNKSYDYSLQEYLTNWPK